MSDPGIAVPVLRSEEQIKTHFADEMRKQITAKRVVLGVGALGALVVLSPVIILAVKAGFALAAAAALGIGGLFAWKRMPYWVLKQENRIKLLIMQEQNAHLARLKAEAKKNPIEQAENEYLRRGRQYEDLKRALEIIGGQVQAFESKLFTTKREKPSYDLSQETAALDKMKLFYNNRKDRLKSAQQKLIQFKEKLEEARTKWEFQLQANAAIRAMNATDQEARINEILTEVSFTAVQQEFDSVFAKLDVDAAEITAQDQLEFAPGVSIDIHNINIPKMEVIPAIGGAR